MPEGILTAGDTSLELTYVLQGSVVHCVDYDVIFPGTPRVDRLVAGKMS